MLHCITNKIQPQKLACQARPTGCDPHSPIPPPLPTHLVRSSTSSFTSWVPASSAFSLFLDHAKLISSAGPGHYLPGGQDPPIFIGQIRLIFHHLLKYPLSLEKPALTTQCQQPPISFRLSYLITSVADTFYFLFSFS